MTSVEFHFDFGSPNAYFSHKLIPAIEKRTGASFVYVPVLLGGIFKLTNNQPPMVQFKEVKNKPAYQQVEMKRFIRKHGLTDFKMNPFFPVNTVQIMRGAVAAQMDDELSRYVDAVYHYMWEDPRKMDDPAVIADTLSESGFDGARMLARIQDDDIKDTLRKNTEASVAKGTFGSPTFFLGEEMYFGKDTLRDLEEDLARTA